MEWHVAGLRHADHSPRLQGDHPHVRGRRVLSSVFQARAGEMAKEFERSVGDEIDAVGKAEAAKSKLRYGSS